MSYKNITRFEKACAIKISFLITFFFIKKKVMRSPILVAYVRATFRRRGRWYRKNTRRICLMEQTETYQLSQWEKTDRILMSDFNADNAKLENALSALAARDTQLNAAIAAAKQELNAALAAAKTELAAESTRLDGAKLEQVTLLSTSYTASGSNYAITVPGSQMGSCSIVCVDITPSSSSNGGVVYPNGSDSWHWQLGKSSTATGLWELAAGKRSRAIFFPLKLSSSQLYCVIFTGSSFATGYSAVTYSSLKSLNLKPASNASAVSGGGSIRIYGLK